jgi:ubiquinone/menaquinone biosynthesis C-methylase UbiE
MERFYNSEVARTYFAMADAANEQWTPDMKPHWHLKHAVQPGSTVVDLGCGSAHVLRHLAERQPRYLGIDWSEAQIARNRERAPNAEFMASSLYDVALGGRQFDVVMALYVIEHAVWPHRMLAQMFDLAAPGGLIAVLTPPFRHRHYLKSFNYGLSAIPFPDKVKGLRILDALVHLYQHRIAYPRLLRREFPRGSERGRFLINLHPVCLDGGPFFPDSDAVYMADTAEIADNLQERGATVLEHWADWGYVLARKAVN